jgi:hypothetical protein
MGTKIRHFISNVISAFIRKKTLRDKVRVMIRYPRTFEYIRFVRELARDMARCDITTHVGRGCHNFIVILNKKYVFKFPLFSDGRNVAEREKRITDAFAKISPIKIPKMKIIPYRDIVVRRYEFADGVLVSDIRPDDFRPHREYVARQIANFMFAIGESDPEELRDLKPQPNEKSDYLYGWFHGDIWQNFMLDPRTYDITYFIDWEDTAFQSFMPGLCVATRTWEKRGYAYMGITVLAEYSKLYLQKHKK